MAITLGVLGLLSTDAGAQSDGWKQATPGYAFRFPEDHASHPDYRIEWWYYTGNLAADDGRRFGFQLTFFRVGVDRAPSNPSRWAVRDLHMAHLAVSDLSGGRFLFDDRLNRAGVGWAGAETSSYRVWNEDWLAMLDSDTGRHLLRAETRGFGLDLALEPGRPPVVHGAVGISQKGAAAGNASHYYSLTRMPTRGTVTLEGEAIRVSGTSWMDHEFGTSFLESGQEGWDWFSIQLDDGTDLMVFQLRRQDGTRDRHSAGTLLTPEGDVAAFGVEAFALEAGETWTSPESGATYPVAWTIAVPSAGLRLDVRAPLLNQELRTGRSTGVTYWEGAVTVEGTRAGRPVAGRGYLEMTGYAGESMGDVLR